jgi:septal ring factor EnvC (AmiA/AmiB activator)
LDIQQNEIAGETDSNNKDLQAQLEQDLQFQVEIQAFEARLDQHDAWWSNQLSEAAERAAAERAVAVTVLSYGPIENSAEEDGSRNESSSLSTVSSSRFDGLDSKWWRKSSTDGEVGGDEVVAIR